MISQLPSCHNPELGAINKEPETTKARGRNRRAFGDLVRLVPVHDHSNKDGASSSSPATKHPSGRFSISISVTHTQDPLAVRCCCRVLSAKSGPTAPSKTNEIAAGVSAAT